jgi:hypothetical protein
MRHIILVLLSCSLALSCRKSGSGDSSPALRVALENLAAANTPELRFRALGPAAKQCFSANRIEEARQYAQELLSLLPSFRQSPDYGQALHDANTVLGRIAVREGRLEDAKRHLLESIRAPNAAMMDYGPSMALANDLLEKGERQAVLDYLARCKRFWNYARLDEWAQQIQRGEIPDFGSYLTR